MEMEFLYDSKNKKTPWQRTEIKAEPSDRWIADKFIMRTVDGRSIEIPDFRDTIPTPFIFGNRAPQTISYYNDWIPYFTKSALNPSNQVRYSTLYLCNPVTGEWTEINATISQTEEGLVKSIGGYVDVFTKDFQNQLRFGSLNFKRK